MDKKKAYLVRLSGEREEFETLYSELEFLKPSGGARTKTAKWGPQDVVQDSKYLEREKHQIKAYFKNVAQRLMDADAIAIFGPGDTNEKFRKELTANYKSLAEKVTTVDKADSMTKNQVRALIRNYFKNTY